VAGGEPCQENRDLAGLSQEAHGREQCALRGDALINEAKSSGEWGQKRTRPQIPADEIPQEFRNALAGNPEAEKNFHALAPSYRKHYILWIALAKRAQTRLRRVQEAIHKLERGERLGLK